MNGQPRCALLASHLSALGFDVRTPEELVALARRVADRTEEHRVAAGRYLRWQGGGGEELWLQMSAAGALVGMHPHFGGKARVRVGVNHRVGRDGDTALDGAFHGWAEPSDAPDDGAYPFVFDSPDAGRHARTRLPLVTDVQIAAFAVEIRSFPTVEAYDASHAGAELRFASRSFVPTGLFDDGSAEARATALLTGHVVDAATLTNALTGRPYHHALVDSHGGRFDVVIDPELLARAPVPGGVVSGTFWLSGRILHDPAPRSWLSRLFG